MDDRLTQLEELYSNQTHAIEQMSLEMFQQQKAITSLRQQLAELKEQVEQSEGEIGGQERPPHY